MDPPVLCIFRGLSAQLLRCESLIAKMQSMLKLGTKYLELEVIFYIYYPFSIFSFFKDLRKPYRKKVSSYTKCHPNASRVFPPMRSVIELPNTSAAGLSHSP